MNTVDLNRIASKLNTGRIRYGLGGSCMLHAYGLADRPRDIDLVASEEDASRAIALLEELGPGRTAPSKPPCCSSFFVSFEIGASEVDLIAGFRIEHEAGIYEWAWDYSSSVTGGMKLDSGVDVPLTSLEDWYVLYSLMGREAKAEAIAGYFRERGVSHPELLRAALERSLPEEIRKRIHTFL